jgi:hypothetical protein
MSGHVFAFVHKKTTPFVVAHQAQAYGWGHRGFFPRGFGWGGW